MLEGLPALAALAADVSRSLGEGPAEVLLYRHGHRLGRAMAVTRPDAAEPPSIPGVAEIDAGGPEDAAGRATGHFSLTPDALPAIGGLVAGFVAGFATERAGAPRVCVASQSVAGAWGYRCGPPEGLGPEGEARAAWHHPEAVPVAAGGEVLQARNATLARQNADLRAAFLDRTEFLADVCHELRTPTTLILGPLDELLETPGAMAPEALRERLGEMRRSVLRVMRLADSILDLSRLDGGHRGLALRPVSLAAFLGDLAQVFRRGFERRQLTLEAILPEGLPPVPADPDALEKIAGNLLSNAMRFTPPGGRVTLRLRRYGGAQVIEVADTGPGIDDADLPHLFERYQRASAVDDDGGLGIGLALVRELVARLGGEVQVHSVVGEGTTFRVFLGESRDAETGDPVVRAAPGAHAALLAEAEPTGAGAGAGAEAPSPSPSPTPGPEPPASRQRILVVEDNPEVRRFLVRLLGDTWDLVLARDGVEALAKAESTPPDLILADVMMPRMDGLTLTSRLRARPGTRDVPVVLLTARGELEHRLRGFDAGADDYVIKPFAGRELVARLRVHLALRAAQAELRDYAGRLERLVDEQVGRIRDQNRRLARANRELEDFLTIASHDLKSPLVSIAGFTAILEESLGASSAPPVRLALDRIAFNIDWMQRLIGGLLSLASVRAGDAAVAQVAIPDLLERVRRRMQPAVEAVGGLLEVHPVAGRCQADPARLEEALANLVENSVKYRDPKRPLRVTLLARRAGDRLHLEVADNGLGIDAAHHERVFQPLFRLGGGVGQGSGLGLYIVRRVMEEAGGRAWVTSTPGAGATLHLELPETGGEEAPDARP